MDARKILGVGPDATDAELRAAYLRGIAQYPPDRSPEEFEKLRDAFETLKDPRRRTIAMLESVSPFDPMSALPDGRTERREFAGPMAWLEVLKGK